MTPEGLGLRERLLVLLFDGRASILKQMLSSTSPPSRNQMDDWRRELEELHGKLEGAAVPLLQLLS